MNLKSGSVAVLAERSTGWCIVNRSGYATLKERLQADRTFDDFNPEVHPLLKQLWNCGLLYTDSKPNPKFIAAPASYPSSLLLKLTGACNLECTYCYDYERERFEARLDFDRARETIAFLLSKRVDLSIVFHGGEPLLRFDLIREIVKFALEAAGDRDRLRFSIQTNGTLFTPRVVQFLEEHRFSVGISLDGIDDESNSLRLYRQGVGSLTKVKSLLDRYSGFIRENCGFLAVVSRTSARHLPSFVLWLQENGIRGLSLSFLDLAGRGENLSHEKLSPAEAVAVCARLIDMIRHGEIGQLALRTLISKIDNLFTSVPRDFCHKGPCAAADDFIVLDAQGAFRTCDCIYNDFFLLGGKNEPLVNLVAQPAREAVRERHVWLRDNGSECRTCALFGLCGGTCVAKAIANHGTPHSVDPTECAISRYLYPELLNEFDSIESDVGAAAPLLVWYYRHRGAASGLPDDVISV
jgi:uncharacterized protein